MSAPAPAPAPAPVTTAAEDQLLLLGANLLPPEIVARRQVGKIRLVAVAILVVTLLLVLAVYAVAWTQKVRSRGDFDEVTASSNVLRAQQGKYRELIVAQTAADQIKGQLATLMADDVTWTPVLRSIRAAAPSGVGLTGLILTVTDPTQRSSEGVMTSSGLPSTTGSPIGALTITGTGSSNAAIATFVDSLAKVSGISGALLTNATEQDDGIVFGVRADLSPTLLSKLYAE
ncbi:hypothetical protein [Cryptosporangium arvum]|uniref:Fimbrial assembly protein (PilN) n=1 Tax=Cryptosporangium arvum DSM 44712 TaxID=927661 RepID=A0A010ZQV3_9ACTN|nr:hypothetical protein [Cryptosporangium arvum]EXG81054.1 hypothetical protein CryarDRAFT_2149 [Cryptosporangium arvum DSM 44712]